MTMHLQRDLDGLRKKLLMLGALVEDAISKAVTYLGTGLGTGKTQLADEIYELEHRIDLMEVEIEEDCLKSLALHQPVAVDLRFIIVVLKVNNDLERMGDQAVNIVRRINSIEPEPALSAQLGLPEMSGLVQAMVRASLDALVNQDVEQAHQVESLDDQVDDIHAHNYETLRNYVGEHAESVATAMSYATISSNLERIGDLSTNIAEEVIFMIEGQVVRHQHIS